MINLTLQLQFHQERHQQAILKSEFSLTVQWNPNKILFLRNSYTEADGMMTWGRSGSRQTGPHWSGGQRGDGEERARPARGHASTQARPRGQVQPEPLARHAGVSGQPGIGSGRVGAEQPRGEKLPQVSSGLPTSTPR